MTPDETAAVEQLRADLEAVRAERDALAGELEDRDRELAESLAQQAATGEILRVIASSPIQLQRVFEAVAERAYALCQDGAAVIWQVRDSTLHCVAVEHANRSNPSVRVGNTLPLSRQTMTGRAVLDGQVVHIHNVNSDEMKREFPKSAHTMVSALVPTRLHVPLLRDGIAIGALVVGRAKVLPFSDQDIALVRTFADQAVIAIENARLFEGLQESNRQVTEALKQQTATAEVLRVIASSPSDLQLVLDSVVERAAVLCGADTGIIQQRDGNVIATIAMYGARIMQALDEGRVTRRGRGMPVSRTSIAGRALLERRTIHVPDALAVMDTEFPESRQGQQTIGFLTQVTAPLLREGQPIGVIALHRMEQRAFSDSEISLLETFADQAVIAIENARLFSELERRNDELQESNRQVTEALEQQTATAEILRVIASSPTDVRPVLNAIVRSTVQLTAADDASIYETRDNHDVNVASTNQILVGQARQSDRSTPVGRAVVDGVTIHMHGTEEEARELFPNTTVYAHGYNVLLAAPLLRDGKPMGALVVARREPRPFSESEIRLLETFADQAVIAIENVRLFEELQEKSQQLAVASQHKSDFLANMSHELRTPLNAIIGYSEMLQEEAEDLDADAFLPDLQRINGAGKHLLGLINDILDLSKIEAGRMDLYLETFSIADLIRDVVGIVQPLVEKNGNVLDVHCQGDIGEMHADQTKVRQTLFNLLSNASKFTEQGTIKLAVRREEPPTPPLPLARERGADSPPLRRGEGVGG